MNDFSVKNAVLYRAGIGWFTAIAEIDSDTIYFPVPNSNIDDFLKTSLVTIEGGTAKIRNLSFKTMGKSESLFTGSGTLLGIITFLRASDVVITHKDGKIEGKLLGYQEFNNSKKSKLIVSLMQENETISNIDGYSISEIKPKSAKDRSRLTEFLTSLSSDSDEEAQTMMKVQLSNTGNHKINVSFLNEIPAWKLAYRMIVLGDDKLTLETFGIVDNTTLMDWLDARLTLSTKTPVSYKYDLSTPHNISRPVINRSSSSEISLTPSPSPSFARSMDFGEVMAEPVIEEDEIFYQQTPVYDPSIEVQATLELGESIDYTLLEPVTIHQKQSSMVPLSILDFTGKNRHYYNEKNHAAHPFYAIEFANEQGFALDSGPITVYTGINETVEFKGEAMMSRIGKGETYLLTYALNRNISVSIKTRIRQYHERIEISSLLRRNVYTQLKTITFTVENKSNEDGIIYLVVDKSEFEPIVDTIHNKKQQLKWKDAGDEYRVEYSSDKESKNIIEFFVFKETVESEYLYRLSIKNLKKLLDNANISEEDKKVISAIYQVTNELQGVRSRKDKAEDKYKRVKDRREQIISTLQVLDKDTEEGTRKKYIKQIEAIDEEITNLIDAIEKYERDIADLEHRRSNYAELEIYIQKSKTMLKKK